MRLPNKVTDYKSSIIFYFPLILSALEQQAASPSDLFQRIKTKKISIGEYIDALDCLFALGKIELDEERRILKYVDWS